MRKFRLILLVFLFSCDCEGDEIVNDCIDSSKAGPRACTFELNPVCGCNGITYGNPCAAESAGVLRWAAGECPE